MSSKSVSRTPLSDCAHCESRDDSILCATHDIRAVIEKVRIDCHFKAGQVIFYAGNEPLGLFTIQDGLVKLEVTSANGSAHTLRMVGEGGVLGYRSLFAGEAYHASAIAVKDSNVCFIPKADLLEIFKTHPDLAMKLLNHLSKELRQAEEKWMDQMDKGAPERIAEAVLFLNDHFKDQSWTRREIAQWAGTTPETVIRTLAQFEKEGLIDQTEGRNIRIVQKEKLKERAN
jgi:CRP-like cAMP-binding protein